jgi:hypothetical protein
MRVYNGLCEEEQAREIFKRAKVPDSDIKLLGNIVVQQAGKNYGQLCWATFDNQGKPTFCLRKRADGSLRVLKLDGQFTTYFRWQMLDVAAHTLMP